MIGLDESQSDVVDHFCGRLGDYLGNESEIAAEGDDAECNHLESLAYQYDALETRNISYAVVAGSHTHGDHPPSANDLDYHVVVSRHVGSGYASNH